MIHRLSAVPLGSLVRSFGAVSLIFAPVFLQGCGSETSDGDPAAAEDEVSSAPFFCPTAENNATELWEMSDIPGPTTLKATRAAGQAGLGIDRFVLEFNQPEQGFYVNVIAQDTATFRDTAEQEHKLEGSRGLMVIVQGAAAWWPVTEPPPNYTGAVNIKPRDTAVLREAKYIEDVEATLTWGLGLSKDACFRVYSLKNPARVVVDIKR